MKGSGPSIFGVTSIGAMIFARVFRAWSGGTSYVLGGSPNATATDVVNEAPVGEPAEESAEPAANGTARVPER